MKIQGNRKGSFLAFSTTCEEWSILGRKGRKSVVVLSTLVSKLTILSGNLLSINTIKRRFLTCQELPKSFLHDVPKYYE
jgi:hypothetical protein